ncbi:unnamed protein product [Symbiodinium microadriaticum]|nr:unnamed protein product [Symbiodinium microadriaticum]
MVGQAAATAGACCDLDVLDQALSAMGHPKGVLCLHGALAVLASCSARLSLRHRPRLSHRLASPSLRKSLVRPRLMHLASPVILRAAPGSGKEASARVAQHLRDAEWWDLQVVSMLSDEPGITRTYRVRGSASDSNFAPFPFGSQDLLWWRSEPSKDELRLLLLEVALGLSMAGIRDFVAFVGTVCLMADESQHGDGFTDSCNAATVPDMVVPWEHREATAAYARNWRSAEPGDTWLCCVALRPSQAVYFEIRRSTYRCGAALVIAVRLLAQCEGLLAAWPDGFSFEIVCLPRLIPRQLTAWAAYQPQFATLQQELRFGFKHSFVHAPFAVSVCGNLTGRTGRMLLEDPAAVWVELPWPAEPRSLVEYRSPRDAEVWCDEARQVFNGGRQSISLAPEFDLSADVSSSSGFYDLFDLRKFSTKEGLALLLDKTALKKRLVELQLPALVPVFSTTTPDLPWEKLRELSQYAIKAAHKHHGGLGVLLMSHGRKATGLIQLGSDVDSRAVDEDLPSVIHAMNSQALVRASPPREESPPKKTKRNNEIHDELDDEDANAKLDRLLREQEAPHSDPAPSWAIALQNSVESNIGNLTRQFGGLEDRLCCVERLLHDPTKDAKYEALSRRVDELTALVQASSSSGVQRPADISAQQRDAAFDPWAGWKAERNNSVAVGSRSHQGDGSAVPQSAVPLDRGAPVSDNDTDFSHLIIGGWEFDSPRAIIQSDLDKLLATFQSPYDRMIEKHIIYGKRARTAHVLLTGVDFMQAQTRFYEIQEKFSNKIMNHAGSPIWIAPSRTPQRRLMNRTTNKAGEAVMRLFPRDQQPTIEYAWQRQIIWVEGKRVAAGAPGLLAATAGDRLISVFFADSAERQKQYGDFGPLLRTAGSPEEAADAVRVSAELMLALWADSTGQRVVMSFLNSLLCEDDAPPELHDSFVTLVPKVAHVASAQQLRPINLVETVHKMYCFLITQRLQKHWPRPPCQLGGLPGSQVLDPLTAAHFQVQQVALAAVGLVFNPAKTEIMDLLTGRHMDEAEVVRWAAKAFEKEVGDSDYFVHSETRCVTNAPVADDSVKQGLLVEELAVTWDGRSGLLPDEAFCFVAWGRLSFFGVMAAGGTWLNYFASDGTPIFARPMKAQKQIEAGGAFRTGLPWGHELRSAVVSLAERAAQALGADFLRIDIFPNGGAPLISEVSIVTGWFGRENLRWGEVDAWLLETLRDQWISGYALSADM